MMSTIKILHLENAISDSDKVKEFLKACKFKYYYKWITKIDDFENEFSDGSHLVIIADYVLLSLDPKKIFSLIQGSDFYIPLILTANNYSRDISVQMMNSGANNILFKDRFENLPLILENAVNRIFLETKTSDNHEKTLDREKKFQALLENISDSILLVDEKGIINYQSPSSERISGFSSNETLGASIFKFIHPSDLAAVTRDLKQTIEQPGVSIENSYRIQLKKGLFIWVESTFTNSLSDPEINAIIINYRDVTERKISEDLLQKSEANLRTIFDNTNVSYVLSDSKFKVLSFNPAAVITYANEFKVKLKEGDSLLDYVGEEKKHRTRKRFEKALSGEKVSYELSFKQEDETTTWYNVNMFAVTDDSNKLLGLIISSENITHRKNIEFERNKMLSDIVQHNKDLEQFAYIISHNLRSPVANILGLSTLIENSPEMDKKTFEECMKGLTLSVKKLDEVIVDLNYILQTRKEINEKKEVVNFLELTNNIKTSINSQLQNQNITISTHFDVSEFFTIKSYIYSIFFNLISNSIKYRNPTTPLSIDIQSKKINNKLVLEFKDNGLGIDLVTHGHTLFGLYKKFHTHIEGKGIGLYMVKTQVEILGGKISVASEVNIGTTFTIEF
ncbi:PAS domain-containing sensor histidine kinase [Aurantibacillus circumpalustris]|uniref:PAS domain-containing sensor histidine kinase n=1 Tax=Aurantibacillus circumpalustris TaxID=3036359 RepID=UPI00295BF913|nr:PAS domain-containing sensor histidine kinase [Aurantibacillus circumpalustris]